MTKRLLLIALGLGAIVAAYGGYVLWGLPARRDVRALAKENPIRTGVMIQREQEARKARRSFRPQQTFVPLSRVSRHLINAVVVAEDPKFFGHEGIDWQAMKESVEADVKTRRFVRGGSTITQQLAKNLFFSTRKSVTRKLREFVVTHWLEEDLSKKRILEIYLNVIEWGDGLYGCEAAAQRYYGKGAADLDADEAAGLAAMIPSPRRINPRVNPARHERARKHILWLMEHAGFVKRSTGSLGVEPTPEPADDDDAEPGPSASPATDESM